MDINLVEDIGNNVKYDKTSVESRRVSPGSVPAFKNQSMLHEEQIRKFDDMVYGKPVDDGKQYDAKKEMEKMTGALSSAQITKSGLPESIKRSIMAQPLTLSPIEDPNMTALEERLQRTMPGIQKSMKILSDLDQYDLEQREKMVSETKPRNDNAATSTIDYSLIKTIVESVVDEKLNGMRQMLNESTGYGTPSLSVMNIRNDKFLFLDSDDNIFECQMVYKGKNKAKRKK
jgi:hypothetical protein